MKIVFFGTPEFGATILEKLVQADLKPVLAVTVPDKPAGRKQLLLPSPVKGIAEQYGIPVFQSEDRSAILKKLSAMEIDLIVLASFGMILSKEILGLSKKGALNVHPSLLPKYRGPSPVQSVILQGEEKTGITIMLMDEQLDHGPILAQREFSIFNFQFSNGQGKPTTPELREKFAQIGGDLLLKTIPQWIAGTITPKEQDHSQATYTKRFQKEDGRIDWEKEAGYIERQVRAFTPWPGTFTSFKIKNQNEKRKNIVQKLKILEAEAKPTPSQHSSPPPSSVIPWDSGFAVATSQGVLVVQQLQMEGKNPVSARDFLLGHKDFLGTILGKT